MDGGELLKYYQSLKFVASPKLPVKCGAVYVLPAHTVPQMKAAIKKAVRSNSMLTDEYKKAAQVDKNYKFKLIYLPFISRNVDVISEYWEPSEMVGGTVISRRYAHDILEGRFVCEGADDLLSRVKGKQVDIETAEAPADGYVIGPLDNASVRCGQHANRIMDDKFCITTENDRNSTEKRSLKDKTSMLYKGRATYVSQTVYYFPVLAAVLTFDGTQTLNLCAGHSLQVYTQEGALNEETKRTRAVAAKKSAATEKAAGLRLILFSVLGISLAGLTMLSILNSLLALEVILAAAAVFAILYPKRREFRASTFNTVLSVVAALAFYVTLMFVLPGILDRVTAGFDVADTGYPLEKRATHSVLFVIACIAEAIASGYVTRLLCTDGEDRNFIGYFSLFSTVTMLIPFIFIFSNPKFFHRVFHLIVLAIMLAVKAGVEIVFNYVMWIARRQKAKGELSSRT